MKSVLNYLIGDSLLNQFGQQFSTFDQDNDILPGLNCAERYNGAWWYRGCFASNLNGFYRGSSVAFDDGVVWQTWTDFKYSLKTSEMKIKPFYLAVGSRSYFRATRLNAL